MADETTNPNPEVNPPADPPVPDTTQTQETPAEAVASTEETTASTEAAGTGNGETLPADGTGGVRGDIQNDGSGTKVEGAEGTGTLQSLPETSDTELPANTGGFFHRLKVRLAGLFSKEEHAAGNVLMQLAGKVFPSNESTVFVENDPDYDGAHTYHIQECTGFTDGKPNYVDTHQTIRFVQKNLDGTMTPGVQSEQLIIMLLDRHEKLNAKFESEQYTSLRHGLLMFLEASENRVKERIARGVMGDLKK